MRTEVVININRFEFGSHSGSYGAKGYEISVGSLVIGHVEFSGVKNTWVFFPSSQVESFPLGETQAIAGIINKLQEIPDDG